MKGFLLDENDKPLSNEQVRSELQKCIEKGWEILPIGECEGFDHFGGGCPGHQHIISSEPQVHEQE